MISKKEQSGSLINKGEKYLWCKLINLQYFKIQMDHLIRVEKPENNCQMDGVVSEEHSAKMKETEKLEKYLL